MGLRGLFFKLFIAIIQILNLIFGKKQFVFGLNDSWRGILFDISRFFNLKFKINILIAS